MKKIFLTLLLAVGLIIGIGQARAALADDILAARQNGTDLKDSAVSNDAQTKQALQEYPFALGGKYLDQEVSGMIGLTDEIKNKWVDLGYVTSNDFKETESIADNSIKGNYVSLFKKLDVYNNELIDVKATIMDFEVGLPDNQLTPTVGFDKHLSLVSKGVKWVKVKFEFLKSGTNTPVSVKGNTTYWDIDFYQGVILDDTNRGVYVKNSPTNQLKISTVGGNKYVYELNDTNKDNYLAPESAFTETFEGSSMIRTYQFGFVNEDPWYDVASFIGLDSTPVVQADNPKPKKTVNKETVRQGEEFESSIKQQIYAAISSNYYSAFEITDTFENVLELDTNKVSITSESGADVTSSFTITKEGQKLKITYNNLSDAGFYGHTYTIKVRTKVRENANLSNYKEGNDYKVPNHATTTYKYSEGDNIVLNSDEVKVKVRPKYTITTHHYKENTSEEVTPNSTTTETKYYGDTYETGPLTSIPEGYELVGQKEDYPYTGIVDDNKDIIFYYKLKDVILTVKHLEEGTNTPLATEERITKKYNDEYTTHVSPNVSSDYTNTRVVGVPSGNITQNLTVTYYYTKKEGDVIVHHYKDGTTESLAADQTIHKKYGEEYVTAASTTIPSNYILKEVPEDYRGIVNSPRKEVTYYYVKKDSKIVPTITKSGTERINSSDSKINYQINYKVDFKDMIDSAVITITDQLPYKIKETESNLDGGVYNDNNKTITWTINENITGNIEKTYTKNIEVKYKDIDASDEVITNVVKGKVVADNKTIEVENTYNTIIDIKGEIKVRYIDEDGNDISDMVTTVDKVGEEYTSEAREIEGYELIRKPDSEKVRYEEGSKTLTYIYKRIKLQVDVRTRNDGGTIEGKEEVFYGNDSTKDKIKIKALDGYVIDKVWINDQEVDISADNTTLTISNFVKMTENKLVEVSFKEKPQVIAVPKTSKSAIVAEVIGLFLLIGVGLVYYFKFYKKTA